MKIFKRIACCISGGVDSSVAAYLLKKKGYDVTGVFMRNWDIADENGICSADREQDDAEYLCRKLQIPFVQANFVNQYWNNVFCEMIQDYENGFTPNPDILCNKKIKFGAFYEYMKNQLHTDAFATGHYANSTFGNYLEKYEPTEGAKLLKANDSFKDQTFFLSQIPQDALQHCMFPLGHLTKDVVKKVAAEIGLQKIIKKRESTGICFIGRRNFQEFIKDYVNAKPGYFIDIETNKIVGEHTGIHNWTVGQRSRVHVQGSPVPYYIVSKDVKNQNILICPGTHHPSLFCKLLVTNAPRWIHEVPRQLEETGRLACDFRFQHTKRLIGCCITKQPMGALHVELEFPLRALTCGQFAVFYLGDECLGSAQIIQLGSSLYELGENISVVSKAVSV